MELIYFRTPPVANTERVAMVKEGGFRCRCQKNHYYRLDGIRTPNLYLIWSGTPPEPLSPTFELQVAKGCGYDGTLKLMFVFRYDRGKAFVCMGSEKSNLLSMSQRVWSEAETLDNRWVKDMAGVRTPQKP